MSPKLDALEAALVVTLGDLAKKISSDRGQLILEVDAAALVEAMQKLRDEPSLGFAQLIDVCGVDYAEWGGNWAGLRFAVVYQLLSIEHNWRIRVRTFCPENESPMIESMTPLWQSADWYEREAFDLYGIVFAGHNDLRRILTDYGFVGHPFRKDFPISGNVEMRYDPEQRRVIYQPVTIEPREIVPRVIREENYASDRGGTSGVGGVKR